MNSLRKLVAVPLVLGAVALLATVHSAPASASYYVNCGNPPGWSGKLLAHNIGCPGARKVFKNIRCSNTDCSAIHSGRWACSKHGVGVAGVAGVGVCHLGSARMRWRVYE